MSLLKRRTGRRVAGVIVGTSLLVLGLEAPAFAVPTISAISPNSGPVGCVVVITGSGFLAPGVTDVDFTAAVAADFQVISDTEIWTTVPAGAANGPITITDATGDVDSPGFTVATPGGCAPTITSFTPTCGTPGTVVSLTGTNLLQDSGGDPAGATPPNAEGADVLFAPYGVDATHTGAPESPTSVFVTVPAGSVDGPIRAETFNATIGQGAVFSTTNFDVVSDAAECPGVGVTEHARSVTLRLRKHLIARGKVSLTDPEDTLTACVAGVRVKIQRKVSGGWKGVGGTTTNDNGGYKRSIKDKPGKYRALVRQISLNDGADLCLADRSPRQTHRH